MISTGEQVPSVTIEQVTDAGITDVDVATLFEGKKVVVFSLPGAFTYTCSTRHLPGFVAKLSELQAQGVDLVACLSVNDGEVMQAWGEQHGALGKIVMLADGSAVLSKALGIDVDRTKDNMGIRCRRGMMVFENGVLTSIDIDTPGKFEVSSAEACVVKLKK